MMIEAEYRCDEVKPAPPRDSSEIMNDFFQIESFSTASDEGGAIMCSLESIDPTAAP